MNPTWTFPGAIARRRNVLALVALAAVLNLAGVNAARADARLVQVDVIDRDDGDVLHVWRDHGRPVVAGRPGARYAVRLANNSGERVLAVVAIDGVNVVSGQTASVGQRGYVLEPWQRFEITGWRKSNDEVAAFEFTSLADSYAARTGRSQDVGVIGVAVFREAPKVEVSGAAPPRVADAAKAASPSPMPAPASPIAATVAPGAAEARRDADADAQTRPGTLIAGQLQPRAAERLGTGHGVRESSVVRTVAFERATTQPEQRVQIRYDSLENLVAAGIVPPPRVAATSPHAFPADPARGYVPDPPLR